MMVMMRIKKLIIRMVMMRMKVLVINSSRMMMLVLKMQYRVVLCSWRSKSLNWTGCGGSWRRRWPR